MNDLRAALDAALGRVSEDALHYDYPVAQSGVPMDPVLFVEYEALRAALPASATDEEPTCANCLRRVAEVDAETGECRACFARPAVPAALDVERVRLLEEVALRAEQAWESLRHEDHGSPLYDLGRALAALRYKEPNDG